jgi:magnesium transporter
MRLMSYIKFNFQVRDEIEHLMDDDGDMAEMYLTEKKEKSEAYALSDLCLRTDTSGDATMISKSAPVSPVESISGAQNSQRAFNSIVSFNKYGSIAGSSDRGENIEQLEMLLEAYFVVIDNTHSKLLSV